MCCSSGFGLRVLLDCANQLDFSIVCLVGLLSVCTLSRSVVHLFRVLWDSFSDSFVFTGNHSASPPGGNQVDGLPPALRLTELAY